MKPDNDKPQGAAHTGEARKAPAKPKGVTDKTWRLMNPKQRAYFASFVQDGNALKAYLDAGYVQSRDGHPQDWLRRRAYQVRKGKAIVKALVEYEEHRADLAEAQASFSLDWIVSEHERIMADAHAKGDLAVETRNLELIGRTRGVYVESVAVDVGRMREYSEAERLEGLRLSRLLLTDGGPGPSGPKGGTPIDSQRESVSDEVLGSQTPVAPEPLRHPRDDNQGDSAPQEPAGGEWVSPGDAVEERELQAAYTHAEPEPAEVTWHPTKGPIVAPGPTSQASEPVRAVDALTGGEQEAEAKAFAADLVRAYEARPKPAEAVT